MVIGEGEEKKEGERRDTGKISVQRSMNKRTLTTRKMKEETIIENISNKKQ